MATDFTLPIRRTSASTAAAAAAALSAEDSIAAMRVSGPLSSLPVYVDVGSRKIDSQIERNGVPVGVLAVNQAALNEAILTRPILQVKVVSQSVPAGTPVPVGTSVDLVMAPPFSLPVGVIDGVHNAFKEVSIGSAYETLVADNPLVNRIVTHAAAGQLSAEDSTAVRAIFTKANITVDDEPGTDVNAAVATLAMLKTFGG